MAKEKSDDNLIAKLKKAGWSTPAELARAGFRGLRSGGFISENESDEGAGVRRAVQDYRDKVYLDLLGIFRVPESNGTYELAPVDEKLFDLMDFHLTRQVGSDHFISPEALVLMQRGGYLAIEPAAEKEWAQEGVKRWIEGKSRRAKPEPKDLTPDGGDFRDRGGRARN